MTSCNTSTIKNRLSGTALLLAFGIWAAATPAATSAEESPRPNIVVVMADDLGFSDIGCYGGEIPTPNIDALAASGLRFTQFYNNAVCGPTRVSLLTGLYCQQVGHSGRHWNEPTDFTRCAGVGELLQAAGYRTIMIGKWQERELPSRHGFDRFFGPMCQGKISYFHEVQLNPFYLNDERWTVPADGFYMTNALSDHAVKFVEEATRTISDGQPQQPFFLYLAYVAPHWPLHARDEEIAPHRERYLAHGWEFWRQERFARQRQQGLISTSWELGPWPAGIPRWEQGQNQTWQAERMAVYSAMVASIDRGVGRVMETIRRAGADRNTLVLFLSDNGAAPDGGVTPTDSGFGFDPKLPNDKWRLDNVAIRPGSGPKVMPGPADTFAGYGLAWTTVSNTPLRSTKTTAYEGGIRTPLVANWPAVITAGGGLCHRVGHVMDILPTCLELAGAKHPQQLPGGRKPLPLEGRSFVQALRGQADPGHPLLAWRAPRNQALRYGKWKLVNAADGQPWELYDLESDGTETKNLAAEHPDLVTELAAKWQTWAERCANRP